MGIKVSREAVKVVDERVLGVGVDCADVREVSVNGSNTSQQKKNLVRTLDDLST